MRAVIVGGGVAGPALGLALERAGFEAVLLERRSAADAEGYDFCELLPASHKVGEVSFREQGRSRVMRRNCGLLRLYGDAGTKRLLGAEMVGPRAEHLAHLLAWACQSKMTVGQMLEMPFYHPVIEEGVRTALRDLQEKLTGHVSETAHCADCTPGM